jgi:hydrogenase maturation protease
MKKKKLVVALGNALVPGDANAVDAVRNLPHLWSVDDDIEILEGGTDLLRLAETLRDRELIVLVDTAVGAREPVTVLEHGSPALLQDQQHAHHLSAVQALELIRWSDESVRNARCVWLLLKQ